MTIFLLLVFAFIFSFHFTASDKIQSETELREVILRHYNESIPPNLENNPFGFFISFYSFLLDDTTGTLSTRLYLVLYWKDERLRWKDDPEIHIPYMMFNSSRIWKPRSTVAFNRAKPEVNSGFEVTYLIDDGTVYFGTGYIIHTICTTNIRYFPFDEHKCHLDIGVLLLEGKAVMFPKAYVESKWTNVGKVWSLFRVEKTANATFTVPTGLEYNVQRVSVILRRSIPMIALGIACPALVCALVGLLPFWMEPNSQARMALGCTSLILLTNLFQKLVRIVPDSGNVTPVIVIYCVTCYWSAFLSTLQTIIASRWDRQSPVSSSACLGLVRALPSRALRLLGLAARAHSSSADEDRLVADEDEETEDQQRKERKDDDHLIIWWSHLVAVFDLIGFGLHFTVFLLLTVSVCITE